jgi:hypothetical protein
MGDIIFKAADDHDNKGVWFTYEQATALKNLVGVIPQLCAGMDTKHTKQPDVASQIKQVRNDAAEATVWIHAGLLMNRGQK